MLACKPMTFKPRGRTVEIDLRRCKSQAEIMVSIAAVLRAPGYLVDREPDNLDALVEYIVSWYEHVWGGDAFVMVRGMEDALQARELHVLPVLLTLHAAEQEVLAVKSAASTQYATECMSRIIVFLS